MRLEWIQRRKEQEKFNTFYEMLIDYYQGNQDVSRRNLYFLSLLMFFFIISGGKVIKEFISPLHEAELSFQ